MRSPVQRYQLQPLFASLLFFVSGTLSILQQEAGWLVIPFVWVVLPGIIQLITNRTEDLYWLMLILLPFSTELNITDSLGMDFPDELLLMIITNE